MAEFVNCADCGRSVNVVLERCLFCGADLPTQEVESTSAAPSATGGGTDFSHLEHAELRRRRISRAAPERMRSVLGLGMLLQMGLAVCALVGSIGVAVGWLSWRQAHRILDGDSIDFASVDAMDTARQSTVLVLMLALIVVMLVWVVWWWRLYKNVEYLGRDREHRLGWAIGAWLVPFANFVWPRQIAGDIWETSDPEYLDRGVVPMPIPHRYNWWWGAWLMAVVVARLNLETDDTTLESFADFLLYLMAWEASLVIAAGFAVAVVRDLTERQDLARRTAIGLKRAAAADVSRGAGR